MRILLMGSFIFLLSLIHLTCSSSENVTTSSRENKFLSVFTVVKFPNEPCGSTSGLNGTCYTSSQCESLGGSSSGSCASSIGVCCVFSLSCGGSSSQNNTYATMTSYTVSSDPDPCTYTFCKSSSDICKLRIEYEVMNIAPPVTLTTAAPFDTTNNYKLGFTLGDCNTDTMTVTNPGGVSPPTICGINTGQHMWVPASDSCNMINFDIDSSSTGTTRTWQIKVTQHTCNDLVAPDQDCLQWHTASSGTVASFNWDTTQTLGNIADSQTHLSSQFYTICIRRERGFCSICYTPEVLGNGAIQSSYGISAGSVAAIVTANIGAGCSGVTTNSNIESSQVSGGDYLEILNMQAATAAAAAPATPGLGAAGSKICGGHWNVDGTAVVQATICTFQVPFKIGVNFDGDETTFAPVAAAQKDKVDNADAEGTAGRGFNGFHLSYWQVAC